MTTVNAWPDGTPKSQFNAFDWKNSTVESPFLSDFTFLTPLYRQWLSERKEDAASVPEWSEYRDSAAAQAPTKKRRKKRVGSEATPSATAAHQGAMAGLSKRAAEIAAHRKTYQGYHIEPSKRGTWV